jgi:hypothetical protein
VLDLTIIHGRNVCALYTTLQSIVSILPRGRHGSQAWLHDRVGNKFRDTQTNCACLDYTTVRLDFAVICAELSVA